MLCRQTPPFSTLTMPAVTWRAAAGRLLQTRWMKLLTLLLMLFALLFTQQLIVTHAYSHLPKARIAQVVAANDAQTQAVWHDCSLCLMAGGFHPFSPSLAELSVAQPVCVARLLAVSPAPTFFCFAAYLSRAPPVALS
jgi:hypothetical protein